MKKMVKLVAGTWLCFLFLLAIPARSQEPKLIIHPNPATETINLETTGTGTIIVFDLQGNKRIVHEVTGIKTALDIRHLPSGMYFAKWTGERAVRVAKFVKK